MSVSLFDVHDPAAPSLLSKVSLGENYSWSEANTDEKAFNVMPDEHLILLPYQGYFTNGYAQRIQLIDLNRDSLAARGVIEHEFQPRRAAVHDDRIVSISGQELLSVDATDRDHPVVKDDLTLAWSVDRLFPQGPISDRVDLGFVMVVERPAHAGNSCHPRRSNRTRARRN